MIPHDAHLHIGSLLFEGIDQIDLTGPFEVLSRIPNATYRIYGKTTAPVRDLKGLRADARCGPRRCAAAGCPPCARRRRQAWTRRCGCKLRMTSPARLGLARSEGSLARTRTTPSLNCWHHRRQRGVTHMTDFPVHTIDSAPERFEAGTAAIAVGIRHDPEHRRCDGDLSGSDQQPRRSVRECAWRQLHGSAGPDRSAHRRGHQWCQWAVAFHTALALKEGIDPADVQAIREGRLPKDGKLAALSALARTMIEKRGRLDDEDIDRFLAAGFGKDHLLEVIAIVAASTITNYTGSITNRLWKRRFRLTPGRAESSAVSEPSLWSTRRRTT